MSTRKSTTARKNAQPLPVKRLLTRSELKIVAEQIAEALNIDSHNIGLVLLLLDHLDQQRLAPVMLSCSISTIKDYLFATTTEAGNAQEELQKEVRGKLLPFSRKGKGTS